MFLTELTSPYNLNTQRRWHTSEFHEAFKPRQFGVPLLVSFGVPLSVPFGVPVSVSLRVPLSVPIGVPLSVSFSVPCRYHSASAPHPSTTVHVSLTRRRNGQNLVKFQNAIFFFEHRRTLDANIFPLIVLKLRGFLADC